MAISLPPEQAEHNPLFSKLLVRHTMRSGAVSLSATDTVATAIRTFVKFKADGLLVLDEHSYPAGVVTKTEIMGAYYAQMDQETQLADIMGTPVISCRRNDSLESALLTMQQARIHRIFVINREGMVVGTLSYPDIVGTLYRYCCDCSHGLRSRRGTRNGDRLRYSIQQVMTPSVQMIAVNSTITQAIEELSAFRLGALLVTDDNAIPLGVLSKTDIALAFCRRVPISATVRAIMHAPVRSCSSRLSLEEGIRTMVFHEISRLFIHGQHETEIIGVLSLSDAARIRSGSCQACSSSRITVKEDPW